ncbi:MAG: sulfatase-like hydrolase/transferase [Methanoregula sp.]|nr:sulfatase-like hydrolase/transferase [Methanoregula sp.]
MTSTPETKSRAVLPIPDRPFTGLVTFDAKDPNSKFPPIEPLRPPKGAPNVLLILLDDAGFAAMSPFGGPCSTPTAERLAAAGLTYNRFHVCALCAPSRQALLTGRNHHAVGMGAITEAATSAPGYSTIRPDTTAPLAEILKMNGYSTAHIGKCHEVPVWQTSQMGPFDQWPTGSGFEHFYGFIGAETDYYRPDLYQGTTPVDPPKTPEEGYHFDDDIATHTIEWIQQQKALMPDKPFFVYLAPGGTHAPHSVPREWSDKYKGKFDQGWDKLREEIFARQKQLGVIPADAELTERPKEIQAWEDVTDALKPVLARQMEVYAGYMEHTDYQIGRVVDAIKDLGILDDTLIIYITGDNGGSGEGGPNGTFNWMIPLNGAADLETPEFMAARIDKFGTPEALNHFSVGWAHATDTPYQWVKQIASHWGGTRNGTIVHWPNGFSGQGEIRTQFSHLIDVATTVLDAAGIPEPTFVNGIQQTPMHGKSLVPSFRDAGVSEFRETQYFEMLGNRGIYHHGWTACTKHSIPWILTGEFPPLDDDVWELYAPDDWSQAHDLAKKMPGKLRELQRLFLIEAVRYNVLPIDDRKAERFNPEIAGRPELIRGNTQMLYSGMRGLGENLVLNVKNKSHAVTAQVVVPEGGATGVIIAQGGLFGGWSLYVKDGRPTYCYNLLGLQRFKIEGEKPIPAGEHQVRMEFSYDGGGLAKGGTVSLYIDGKKIGEGRVDRTEPMVFSLDDKTDVGSDRCTPVSDDYDAAGSNFNGRIKWVQIDLGEDAKDADHLITPEERYRIAVTLQ